MLDTSDLNIRPSFDKEILDVANYVCEYKIKSKLAYETAQYCFMDAIGCGLLALKYPECTKLLGPIVVGSYVPGGAHVFGTQFELDPVQAAFDMGTLIRWLDFNDTWLAAEWGHPSDNLGGILAVADFHSRHLRAHGKPVLKLQDVFTALIKAYEIQGVIGLENSFNRVGLDHVVLVKVATTAVVTQMLGGSFEQICNAISLAWVDGQSLRTYRHAPNTGTRKSWAAGDATRRGVYLALIAMKNEMGYPSVLTAKHWGFYDIYFQGKPFKFSRDYGSYVMENILFKVSFPAEFHAQTAVECAFKLHPLVKDRLDEIEKIQIRTQESAARIISKQGPLYNPADRDHCLQYMIAIGLIYGQLTADHYGENTAKNPQIDVLRNKMHVSEDKNFSHDYLDPEKRSIANAVQIFFKDGSSTEEVVVEYPIGHKRRRAEGLPLLEQKIANNFRSHYTPTKTDEMMQLFGNSQKFAQMGVDEFMDLLSE
jgi:2-methylcitrate dehydratase